MSDGWQAFENFAARLCNSVWISNGQTMENKLFLFLRNTSLMFICFMAYSISKAKKSKVYMYQMLEMKYVEKNMALKSCASNNYAKCPRRELNELNVVKVICFISEYKFRVFIVAIHEAIFR